ncbi:MAG: ABC transporter ATP-binding protein, partial [Alphaproteobacteria bacterium]
LLGSSGSGKSTLLKIIGGFDLPTTGRVYFDSTDVTQIPANKRPSNTVFQDLALFPHMSVGANVAYGLNVRGEPKTARAKKVAEALALVDLVGFEGRNVNVLSGGQRQRVALARALVMEPGILLLDEPLTGLDERLRQQMRDEFGRLHKKTGATFVLVTHNQDEALSLSDRMAILHEGRLEQVGTPTEFLNRPANEFVARFIGLDSILRPAEAKRDGADLVVTIAGKNFVIPQVAAGAPIGQVGVRADRIALGDPGDTTIVATIEERNFRGRFHEFGLLLADGQKILAELPAEVVTEQQTVGSNMAIRFRPGALIPIPDDIN